MKQQIHLLLFAIKLHFGSDSLGVIFLCANRTKGLCILSFNTHVHATANEPLNVSKFSKINSLFTQLNKVLEVEIKQSTVKGYKPVFHIPPPRHTLLSRSSSCANE